MIATNHTIRRETRGNGHILDLTADVQAAVAESGVRTGQATLMVVGSTAALTTLEYEPGLVDHDIGPSLALPVTDGAVPLGTWQQVVLIDLDTRPRDRTVAATILGV